MAEKKMVEAITSMEEDFAQWYTDVVKKAELIDYTSVKGCTVIKPAGYAIWELIQKQLDARLQDPLFCQKSVASNCHFFIPCRVLWYTHQLYQTCVPFSIFFF